MPLHGLPTALVAQARLLGGTGQAAAVRDRGQEWGQQPSPRGVGSAGGVRQAASEGDTSMVGRVPQSWGPLR